MVRKAGEDLFAQFSVAPAKLGLSRPPQMGSRQLVTDLNLSASQKISCGHRAFAVELKRQQANSALAALNREILCGHEIKEE